MEIDAAEMLQVIGVKELALLQSQAREAAVARRVAELELELRIARGEVEPAAEE